MSAKQRVMVTGATGFVGQAIIRNLLAQDYDIVASVRHHSAVLPPEVTQINIGNILLVTNWSSALQNVDIVIHTAARAHILDDSRAEPFMEFRKVNTEGAITLAIQAAEAGVKRFIFISSVKVNGEETKQGNPFKDDDDFVSTDPYGLSKHKAEKGLLGLAAKTGMEVVIIRPPLVYGPHVKANFATMMKWMYRGIPLPFGAIHNQRSLVALDNLVSFIVHCIDHPKAVNEVFLVSDGEDVSTTELLRKVAKAFEKKALLIPIPVWLMTWAAKLMGKGDVANRLFGSLQVDSSKACDLLGWKPVITMDEQLKKTANAYLNEKTL